MRALGNDLEEPAAQLAPVIASLLDDLRSRAEVLYAALSGSGATVFAITNDRAAAEQLADALIAARPDCWVRETMLGA